MGPRLLAAADSVTGLDPTWEHVIGRLHPVFVHLPIGLFVAAGVLALLGGARGRFHGSVRACLVLGLLGALAAGGTGWLFAFHDHDDAEALDTHRWSGVATAALGLVVLLVGLGARAGTGRARAYRWGVVVLAGVTAFTGHAGGELVWGEGYATAPLRAARAAADAEAGAEAAQPVPTASTDRAPPAAPLDLGDDAAGDATAPGTEPAGLAPGDGAPAADPAESEGQPAADPADGSSAGAAPEPPAVAVVDFHAQIAPIFGARCVECHGPAKARGRLRLDAAEFVFSGDNPVIVPGDPEGSELLRRVMLPPFDLDRMPEEGDPLSAEQIELLRRWIAQGAPWPEEG